MRRFIGLAQSSTELTEFVPIFLRGDACYFPENIAEGFCIGVTDGVHYFVDVLTGGFEAPLGGLDLYALDVIDGRYLRSFFEAAGEIDTVHRAAVGQVFYRDLFFYFCFDVFLDGPDGLVLMVFHAFEKNEGRLGVAIDINLQHFGAVEGGGAAAVFLDQIKYEVEAGGGAAGGVYSVFVGDDLVGLEIEIRKALTEGCCGLPVGAAGFVLQETGGGQQEGAGAEAGDFGAFLVLADHPVEGFAAVLDPKLVWGVEGGQDYAVGVFDGADVLDSVDREAGVLQFLLQGYAGDVEVVVGRQALVGVEFVCFFKHFEGREQATGLEKTVRQQENHFFH